MPCMFSFSHSPPALTSGSDDCPSNHGVGFFVVSSIMDQSIANLKAHYNDFTQVRKSALPVSLG